MKFQQEALISSLEQTVRKLLLQVNQLEQEDPELLLSSPAPGKWSIVQVMEHLNTYDRYYLPRIKEKLHKGRPISTPFFYSGWLGNYFTQSMLPKKDRVVNKMKTLKKHFPDNDLDPMPVMVEMKQSLLHYLDLLEKARKVNLSERIPITISPLIRLKTGDCLRFLLAHYQRHFVQINENVNVLKTYA